jgi:methylenetetrahydrofolate dehydrogenase (NADP+)/methenyltetrahydrofolate cyclohydrolase
MTLLDAYDIDPAGKHAVVVGRGAILGKPMAMMLLNKNATVTIGHAESENLPDIVRQADIVVGAVGRPEFIRGDWIKDGAILIDAGYNEGGLGDIELQAVKARCYAYTPVPGGVGPMTIATLVSQTVAAAEKQHE